MEIMPAEDTQELHAALHDACRCVAIAVADAVGQAAMVYADAYGGVVLLADIDERNKPVFNLLQFPGIFLVRVLQLLERPCRIHIVAWIDADLLCIEGSHVSYVRIEVDVSTERCHVAVGPQLRIDVLEILCLSLPLRGEAHEFSSCINDALCLCHAPFGIVRGGGGH